MGAKIIFPARANGHMATAAGTKVFLDGVKVKDVSAVSVPEFGVDDILTVTITVPLESVSYAEEDEVVKIVKIEE